LKSRIAQIGSTATETPKRDVHAHQESRLFAFRHFPPLDGLRGLAILLVVVGHVLAFDFGLYGAGSLGGLGVLLFFVLSGFLITGLLDRELRETGDISLSQFYLRRVLRLFPALFCFLAVLCILIELGIVTDTPWYTILACLVYVRNIWGRGTSSGHLWSLSIEEQFYMLWPVIMRVFSRIAALRVAIAGSIAITLFRMIAIHWEWFNYGTGVFYERSWFRFDSILIGCAVALFLSNSTDRGFVVRFLSSRFIPMFVWPILIAWTIRGEAKTHAWYLTIQTVLAAVLLINLLVASNASVYLSVLSHPLARWFGRISYSWYLWQQLFTVFVAPSWLGLRTFPYNVAVSLLLAVISRAVVEQPFLKMKERISYRVSRRFSCAAALEHQL
jgi:peptidoglycan/LPS O-acetylase OafA/YrhL